MKKLRISKATILAGLGCFGVAVTGITTFFATRKASKYLDNEELTRWQKAKKSLPYFILPLTTGCGTILAIITSNRLSIKTEKKLVAALVSGGELSSQLLSELESKTTKKEYEKIIDELKGNIKYTEYNGVVRRWTIPEELGGETFEATDQEVTFAILHVLEHFCQNGDVNVNVLRQYLGLDWDPKFESVGWCCQSGIYTVPFNFSDTIMGEDGVTYKSLDPIYSPEDLSQYDY